MASDRSSSGLKLWPQACLWLLGIVLHLGSSAALAADGPPPVVRLENRHVAVVLSRRTGGVTMIENRLTGQNYELNDPGFRLEAGTGTTPKTLGYFGPLECELKSLNADHNRAEYVFAHGPLTVTLSYRLEGDDSFVVKQVRVRYAGSENFHVRRFEMFDWGVAPKPVTAIPFYGYRGYREMQKLDDGEEKVPSDNSTAFFLRYRNGGIFTSMTCDYVAMQVDARTSRFQSTYWPGFVLNPDQTFESEQGIIGVYRRKGQFFPHRPQSGEQLETFLSPDLATRLDRGEIDAMIAVVNKFTSPGVYCTLVNAWAIGLPHSIGGRAAADVYNRALQTLAKIPELKLLHFIDNFCGLSREFARLGLGMPLRANPFAEEFFRNVAGNGLGLSMFIWASASQVQPTGWSDLYTLTARGERNRDNIAISKSYAEFIYNAVAGLRERYPVNGLSVDFLYPTPDYDASHGYMPGRASLYPQYKHMVETYHRLRTRYPDLMLRGQLGHAALGPWLSNHMSVVHNADDHGLAMHRNFLDFHASHHLANNMRLTNWLANSCKMKPRHKMNSEIMHSGKQIRAWDYIGWRYNVLSQIAAADNLGEFDNLPDEAQGERFPAEDLQFLKKWVSWHKTHQDYYRRENRLFGEPRVDGVDGYAYGNGRDSIVFLCNPTYRTVSVAVPVNHEIHLSGPGNYTIKELEPEARLRIGLKDGVFEYGTLFVTEVAPQTVMVLEVKPDDSSSPLLLGVGGRLSATDTGLTIESMRGPRGRTRLIAVRLPPGQAAPANLSMAGKPLAARRVGNLLLARVKFEGDEINPEVSDWRAVRIGGGVKIRARIQVPAMARALLASQQYPVSAKYNTREWFGRVAWLGSDRFIIYLPVLPLGVDADTATGDETYRKLEAEHLPKARLNGKPVMVRSNLLGDQASRWAGFFIDASNDIAYGRVNELELDLREAAEDRFYGIFLPNLQERDAGSAPVPVPLGRLDPVEAPEAEDPFVPVPLIDRDGERISAHLQLILKADNEVLMSPDEIRVEEGRLSERQVVGDDPRWVIPEKAARRGEVLLTSKPKYVRMRLAGTSRTRVLLGSGTGACTFTLGDLLRNWELKNDPFDPLAAEMTWPAKRARVSVELSAPPLRKKLLR